MCVSSGTLVQLRCDAAAGEGISTAQSVYIQSVCIRMDIPSGKGISTAQSVYIRIYIPLRCDAAGNPFDTVRLFISQFSTDISQF